MSTPAKAGPRSPAVDSAVRVTALAPWTSRASARHRAGDARLEHRRRRAVDHRDHRDLPQPHRVRQEEEGGERLGADPDQVRADHHGPRVEAVREDPAEYHQAGEARGGRGHHQADVAGRVAVRQQARGQRHRQHGVAEHRHRAGGEVEPEVRRPQPVGGGRAERVGAAGAGGGGGRAGRAPGRGRTHIRQYGLDHSAPSTWLMIRGYPGPGTAAATVPARSRAPRPRPPAGRRGPRAPRGRCRAAGRTPRPRARRAA